MFEADLKYDSGDRTAMITFSASPNIYASISGGGTVCTPSGCTGQIVFSATGCLTGNNKFRTIVECVEDDYGVPQYTQVSYEANPDIFSIISGSGTSVTASGCDAKIIFDTSGCPDFGVSVEESYGEEGDARVTFYLTGNSCSGAGSGSGITGTLNIGAGSGIASGVIDRVAYFKSLIGGTNLQITGDEYGESLILNVTGISGGGGSGITGTENLGAGSGIASGVVDNIAYFKSLIGGDNLEIVGDEYGHTLTFNVTGVSGGSGGGCTGFTSVTVDSTTYEPDVCGSGITFEGTGCLGLEAETIVDGIKIKYGICDTQILECLGYYEKVIEICEGDATESYTFLVKE
jgi:hypothetical protein